MQYEALRSIPKLGYSEILKTEIPCPNRRNSTICTYDNHFNMNIPSCVIIVNVKGMSKCIKKQTQSPWNHKK